MTVEIEHQYPQVLVPAYQEIIRKLTMQTMDYEGCPYETHVYVLLTGDEEIRELNRLHRGLDRPTDVLSFPMTDYLPPASFQDLEERDPDAFDPDSGELILGDILLSMDRVKEQAADYGHSLKRELAFLVVHSLLHLIGYDHMNDQEARIMEEKQEQILDLCGYSRGVE